MNNNAMNNITYLQNKADDIPGLNILSNISDIIKEEHQQDISISKPSPKLVNSEPVSKLSIKNQTLKLLPPPPPSLNRSLKKITTKL